MCCNTFNIKPVNPTASKHIFCQCGICEDCRKAERNQWSFRLQAELLGRQRQGWKVGFFTLTYNEKNLPAYYLDGCDSDGVVSLDIDPWEAEQVTCFPCFSRSHVRNFILSVRKKLHRDYGIAGISYMVCSEYGEHTQRPHYHGVVSWPPQVDSETMHNILCEFWNYGFVFPKDCLGGVDSHGYTHKPFEVSSVNQAAKYCAKYVCKDLNFWREAIDAGIDVRDRKFRKEYAPFHLQSRGLGQQFLVGLSDSEKADILLNGYAFVGDDVRRSVPIYFRNKLIFDTHYVYDIYTKNRLVRRQANEFFNLYKKDIYEQKKKVYVKLFDNLKTNEFLDNRIGDYFRAVYGDDAFCNSMFIYDVRESVTRKIRLALNLSSDKLAEHYLSWYGVPINYRLDNPCESWFNHFTQFYEKTDNPKQCEVADEIITILLLTYKYVHSPQCPQQELIDYVADYHKHLE